MVINLFNWVKFVFGSKFSRNSRRRRRLPGYILAAVAVILGCTPEFSFAIERQ